MLTVPVVICLLTVTSVSSQSVSPAPDIEQALSTRPHYSMFLDLIKTSGLMDDLKAASGITMFAPTNLALSNMWPDDYNNLKTDQADLQAFIKYHTTEDEAWHVFSGAYNDKVFDSLNGLPIRINVYWQLHTVSADGCNITERNIRVSNGYIHGIEDFMRAPDGDVVDLINNNPDLTSLAKLLALSGLEGVLREDNNITVFAPNNDAFVDLGPELMTYLQQNPATLKEVLLYHVIQRTTLYSIGMRHAMAFQTSDSHKDKLVIVAQDHEGEEQFYLNHAALDATDLGATNGVVHTIEQLLIPVSVLVQLEDMGFGHLLG